MAPCSRCANLRVRCSLAELGDLRLSEEIQDPALLAIKRSLLGTWRFEEIDKPRICGWLSFDDQCRAIQLLGTFESLQIPTQMRLIYAVEDTSVLRFRYSKSLGIWKRRFRLEQDALQLWTEDARYHCSLVRVKPGELPMWYSAAHAATLRRFQAD